MKGMFGRPENGNIQKAFNRVRAEKRAAFIPYITAGDPHLDATKLFVRALSENGADIIELGVPFSDPVADGPTNQAAATRALEVGTTLQRILELVRALRSEGIQTPIVLFTYLNPVYRLGYEVFARRAKESGADGVLCVDLPPEEGKREYLPALRREGLDTIFLASPTTSRERLPLIDEASSGFVYYASRTGVTGTQETLASTVIQELDQVKPQIRKPLAVGFGISSPEHVRALAPHCDAVVVGSALVKIIEKYLSDPAKASAALAAFALTLTKELTQCSS
jgi:tryptophan synthase alpha chain